MVATLAALGIDFFTVPILPQNKRPADLFATIRSIKRIVKQERVDIVHSHHRLPEMLAKLALLGTGVPTVATVHALVGGMKLLSFRSDKLFAVSNAIVEMLTSEFSISYKRIEIVRNIPRTLSQPLQDAVENFKTAFNFRTNEFIVSGVGRLHHEKGFDLLLQAMSCLTHLPITLLLAGNGPEKAALKQYAAQHKLNVHFLDEVKDVELIYHITDAVVVPSRQESAGLVAIEAAAFSKPVIATSIGGLIETIQHNESGILVPPEAPQSIAAAIENLYNDRQKATLLGQALHRWVLKNYSAEQIGDRVERVYHQLAGKR